jgi:hypothetical protein
MGTCDRNVADQRADPESTLNMVCDLIELRKAFVRAPYRTIPAPEGAWAYERGDGVAVALNLSGREVRIEGVEGEIAICTNRARSGEQVTGSLSLPANQGAVIRR